jgi:hypothetical protein
VRQTPVVPRLVQGQLLADALLAFAQGHNTPPDGGHGLAGRQVDALNERGVDVPTPWGYKLFDAHLLTEHHSLAHLNQPSASAFLDDLQIE